MVIPRETERTGQRKIETSSKIQVVDLTHLPSVLVPTPSEPRISHKEIIRTTETLLSRVPRQRNRNCTHTTESTRSREEFHLKTSTEVSTLR